MPERFPVEDLHPLLRRQLARQGIDVFAATAGFLRLVMEVDEAYRGFDADRVMLERSLELSSQEMSETNQELQQAVTELREAEVSLEARVQERTEELAEANEELSREITVRLRSEQEMAYQAMHDSMTGLPNRRAFFEFATNLLKKFREDNWDTSLIYLDLDQFKDVNDTRGHLTGDELLVQFSETLKNLIPVHHFLARFGGDEFGVLLPGASIDDAVKVADLIRDGVAHTSYQIDDRPLSITASMGISAFTKDDFDPQDVLSRSDQALYEAKAKGRNRYAVVRGTKNWRQVAEQRLLWHSRVLQALKESRFTLFLQPIVKLSTGEVAWYEALLRLRGQRGFVRPGDFLGIAERTGLSLQIDQWVIADAIRLIAEFGREGIDVKLAVNLSAEALDAEHIRPLVQEQLTKHGVQPESLIFEITESAAVTDLARAKKLITSIKDLGCAFALDDFGAGFSSLRELKYLPVDILKIDGDFIEHLHSSEVDQSLVQAIAAMARALGKTVVAEYVTDEASIDLLRSFGIELGQGYHLGRPDEASKVLDDLHRQRLAVA